MGTKPLLSRYRRPNMNLPERYQPLLTSMLRLAWRKTDSVGDVTQALTQLDRARDCQGVADAAVTALSIAGLADDRYRLFAQAAAAYPGLLPIVGDMASTSSEPEIRKLGRELLDRVSETEPVVPLHPPRAADRWREVEGMNLVDSRHGLVHLLELLRDTWLFLEDKPTTVHIWKNRTLPEFLWALQETPPTTSWLYWRWGSLIDEIVDLADLLGRLPRWYASDPCLPDVRDEWSIVSREFVGAVVG